MKTVEHVRLNQRVIALVVIIVALMHCRTTDATTITNGSFEAPQLTEYQVWHSGDTGLTGWTIEPSVYNYVFQYLNSSGAGMALDGNAYLSLSYTTISQPLNDLEIGEQYQLDFWTTPYTSNYYYGQSTITVGIGNEYLVYSYPGPYPGDWTILPFGDPAHPWKQQSVTFTATAEQMLLSFTGGRFGSGGQFGNSIPAIDDVTIRQVPEPSVAFLFLGGGVICLRRTRGAPSGHAA